MNIKPLLFVLIPVVLSTLLLPAMAQETPRVFQEKDITEAAIIEAFSPEKARTRSFKVSPNQPDQPDLVAEKPDSASVLITFETNSAKLTPGAKRALDVVGRALNMDKLANFKFAIEGHTDPRGSLEFNQRLSQDRAETVVDYLVHEHNIAHGRLIAIGKGYSELLDWRNPTAQENRRVTLTRVE